MWQPTAWPWQVLTPWPETSLTLIGDLHVTAHCMALTNSDTLTRDQPSPDRRPLRPLFCTLLCYVASKELLSKNDKMTRKKQTNKQNKQTNKQNKQTNMKKGVKERSYKCSWVFWLAVNHFHVLDPEREKNEQTNQSHSIWVNCAIYDLYTKNAQTKSIHSVWINHNSLFGCSNHQLIHPKVYMLVTQATYICQPSYQGKASLASDTGFFNNFFFTVLLDHFLFFPVDVKWRCWPTHKKRKIYNGVKWWNQQTAQKGMYEICNQPARE